MTPEQLPDPPAPDRETEIVDMVLDWLQVNVLKLIALRVVPLVMASGVVVGTLAWVQDVVGLDLDPLVVTGFVVSVMSGVVGIAFAYVKNHGGAAGLGGVLLELLKLKEIGQATQPPGIANVFVSGDDPTVPPGVSDEEIRNLGGTQ